MSAQRESGGALERLALEDVRAPTHIACEHLHRYELAAALCRGLRVVDVCCGSGYGCRMLREGGATHVTGVDVDAQAIAAAREAVGADPRTDLVAADAAEFVEQELTGRFDALVMFEGLEHLTDPDRALAAIRPRAEAGLRCLISIPNGRIGDAADNPFHRTDYDHARALSALMSLSDDVVVLWQFAAEGSLIRGDSGGELAGRTVLDSHGDPELCDHFIGLVNFSDRIGDALPSGRMLLDVAPVHRAYVEEVEDINRRLWETVEHFKAEIKSIEASLSWRITAPLRRAKRGVRRR